MTWTADFLNRCLEDIPPCRYRRRLQAELEDHLFSLAADLEETGLSPEDAQEQALAYMGDPEKLNRSCREEFHRRQQADPLHQFKILFNASLFMGGLYLFAFFFLLPMLGFSVDAQFEGGRSWMLRDNPHFQALFGTVLFLTTYPLGSLALRMWHEGHPHRTWMVTLGLLFTRAGEQLAISFFGFLLFRSEFAQLLTRSGFPWFQPAYILLTVSGCLLLGWLSGRRSTAKE